jgi:pyroglutamyl-peptidase
MPRILVTAYGPYDEWTENSSWLVLQELTRALPATCPVTTRLYPVDFSTVKSRLTGDLREGFDVVIHLGQAPGRATIALEAIGLNLAVERGRPAEEALPLMEDGPAAYCSRLPLGEWASALRGAGIPVEVSHHAGTYLCNAALYLSHYFIERMGGQAAATFLHLPLDPSQVIACGRDLPSLPAAVSARAVQMLIERVLNEDT